MAMFEQSIKAMHKAGRVCGTSVSGDQKVIAEKFLDMAEGVAQTEVCPSHIADAVFEDGLHGFQYASTAPIFFQGRHILPVSN